MSDLLVFLNPLAGGGRAPALWARLCRRVPELGAARLVASDEALAEALADDADRADDADDADDADARLRRLLVVGGDGTLNRVVNRLDALGALARRAVGILPAGTGCDFARTLGVPRQPERAARRLLAATPRPVDLLELRRGGMRRLVVNVASAGVSGMVDEMVNARSARGELAYLACTLRGLARYRPVPCRVRLDGEAWYEGPVFLLAVANGRSFGKGMKVAPLAAVDDGLADVVLVRDVPRWQLPLQLPRIYLGTHLASPFVTWRRAREVDLEPLAPLPLLDLDGETEPSGSFTVRVLPGALTMLA